MQPENDKEKGPSKGTPPDERKISLFLLRFSLAGFLALRSGFLRGHPWFHLPFMPYGTSRSRFLGASPAKPTKIKSGGEPTEPRATYPATAFRADLQIQDSIR
jgi:hypothetical protein